VPFNGIIKSHCAQHYHHRGLCTIRLKSFSFRVLHCSDDKTLTLWYTGWIESPCAHRSRTPPRACVYTGTFKSPCTCQDTVNARRVVYLQLLLRFLPAVLLDVRGALWADTRSYTWASWRRWATVNKTKTKQFNHRDVRFSRGQVRRWLSYGMLHCVVW
jgi:hypothetical protein